MGGGQWHWKHSPLFYLIKHDEITYPGIWLGMGGYYFERSNLENGKILLLLGNAIIVIWKGLLNTFFDSMN